MARFKIDPDRTDDAPAGGADPAPDAAPVEILVRVSCAGLPGLHERRVAATVDGDVATDAATGQTYRRGSDREGGWAYPAD